MIQLGDEVEDTITGFRGIAIARHSYIIDSNNISVQPIANHHGVLPDAQVLPESLLIVTRTRIPFRTDSVIKMKGSGKGER